VFSNGTLVIEKVQSGVDGGSYRCEATNKQGDKARGTAQITVMGKLLKRICCPFTLLFQWSIHRIVLTALFHFLQIDG
jgi:hypothetical protein